MDQYTPATYLLTCLAALAAGAVNAIAGGGTLLTFPSLLGPIGGVLANATSTIALLPGSIAGAWGYRTQLAQVRPQLLQLILPSILGGILGSYLVVEFKRDFEQVYPWLMLLATFLLLMQRPMQRWMGTDIHTKPTRRAVAIIIFAQFLISVYGGYFGAGIGILMLSTLGFMGFPNIHAMNAAKTVLASIINFVTVVIFLWDGLVVWKLAIPMAVTAIIGGYLGARVAQKMTKETVRRIVVAIAVSMTIYVFWKQLG